MKTHHHARKLLAGSAVVIWLGAVASLILSAAIGAQTSLAIGAMSGVIGVILTVSAHALVQVARAMVEIAANTAVLAGRAGSAAVAEEADEADDPDATEADEPEDLPKIVGRIEPRMQPQGRIEPPLYRPGTETGGLRAVRG